MADEKKKDELETAETTQQYPRATYQGQYDAALQELYKQVQNQKTPELTPYKGTPLDTSPFVYNAAEDALYQQYVDRYMQGGKQAMIDTMGQAAALTGGYGSSYGQAVGQQTYDNYMLGLNDKLFESYDRAFAADQARRQYEAAEGERQAQEQQYNNNLMLQLYQLESDKLNNLLGQTGALADTEYQRIFQEAQLRRELGDDSLLRQLLGMPVNTPVAYDPWGYGNGNETLGGGGGGDTYGWGDLIKDLGSGANPEQLQAVVGAPGSSVTQHQYDLSYAGQTASQQAQDYYKYYK